MTRQQQLEAALVGYFGGVNPVLWLYLEVRTGQRLTLEDRTLVLREILGHKDEAVIARLSQ